MKRQQCRFGEGGGINHDGDLIASGCGFTMAQLNLRILRAGAEETGRAGIAQRMAALPLKPDLVGQVRDRR